MQVDKSLHNISNKSPICGHASKYSSSPMSDDPLRKLVEQSAEIDKAWYAGELQDWLERNLDHERRAFLDDSGPDGTSSRVG